MPDLFPVRTPNSASVSGTPCPESVAPTDSGEHSRAPGGVCPSRRPTACVCALAFRRRKPRGGPSRRGRSRGARTPPAARGRPRSSPWRTSPSRPPSSQKSSTVSGGGRQLAGYLFHRRKRMVLGLSQGSPVTSACRVHPRVCAVRPQWVCISGVSHTLRIPQV